MPKTLTRPEELAKRLEAHEESAGEADDRRHEKQAKRLAGHVLRAVSNGRTDIPARTSLLPSVLSYAPALEERTVQKLKHRLTQHGVDIDTYSTYKGTGDFEGRVAVTKVGDKEIAPSPDYQRELNSRRARDDRIGGLEVQAMALTEKTIARRQRRQGRNQAELEAAPVYLEQTGKYVRQIGRREYITGDEPHGVVNFARFASDEAYAEALSTKVIQCVDILVHDPDTGTVLIGSRQQEPHSGDWVIGGGMKAGESVADAAHRNMKRELKLDIDDSLLEEVGNYKFIWDTRAQNPTVNEAGQEVTGCHMSSTLVAYPMSQGDINLAEFNEEYSDLRWEPASAILGAPEGTYHPCLVDMVADMKAAQETISQG